MLYSFTIPKVETIHETAADRAAQDPTTYILIGILVVGVLILFKRK